MEGERRWRGDGKETKRGEEERGGGEGRKRVEEKNKERKEEREGKVRRKSMYIAPSISFFLPLAVLP